MDLPGRSSTLYFSTFKPICRINSSIPQYTDETIPDHDFIQILHVAEPSVLRCEHQCPLKSTLPVGQHEEMGLLGIWKSHELGQPPSTRGKVQRGRPTPSFSCVSYTPLGQLGPTHILMVKGLCPSHVLSMQPPLPLPCCGSHDSALITLRLHLHFPVRSSLAF